jgi:hypothetical protein
MCQLKVKRHDNQATAQIKGTATHIEMPLQQAQYHDRRVTINIQESRRTPPKAPSSLWV